jgi:mRNA interferase MazF
MAQGQKVANPRRAEIYLVSFDPTVGREIRKTRPALIIQNNFGNRYGDLTIVAPITSKVSPVPYPVEVLVQPSKANGLLAPSAILLDQIRTVDKLCLMKRLGAVDPSTMRRVDDALQISLSLVEV